MGVKMDPCSAGARVIVHELRVLRTTGAPNEAEVSLDLTGPGTLCIAPAVGTSFASIPLSIRGGDLVVDGFRSSRQVHLASDFFRGLTAVRFVRPVDGPLTVVFGYGAGAEIEAMYRRAE